jgi:hypothetical protein
MHVAPACTGYGEWSDHLRSYVRSLSLHFCKRLFQGLETMTSWSQGNNFMYAVFDCISARGYFKDLKP